MAGSKHRAPRHWLLPALAGGIALLAACAGGSAEAQYFRRPESILDPRLMQIDETKVLGARIDPATPIVDLHGHKMTWGDFSGKPVILVLSYFTCDGTCSIINGNLRELLRDTKAVRPGTDYQILTLSFDHRDETKSANYFRRTLDLTDELARNWTFATFADEETLKATTEKIGFKFFWSPQDQIFLHPGVFLFFTPEGRLARVLYQDDVTARDVELAVLDAREGQFKPNEFIKLALSICYSYSYKDGKYLLNLPIFIGFASFCAGLGTLFGSMALYRSKNQVKLLGKPT